MRKTLIALAMLGTAAAVTPAAAQYYPDRDRYDDRYGNGNGYGQNYSRERLQRIAERISRADQRGTISDREASLLRRDLNTIYQLDRRYRVNGFNRWEISDLDRRTDALQQRLRWERNDGNWRNDGRWDRDGRYDRYDRYDRDDD
jgi:hypothetical protein